jgi:simple sugar transport system ATP-binding protein
MTLAENLVLSDVPAGKFGRGFVGWSAIRRDAKKLLEEYDVRPPDPSAKAASLSGGNQQKVVLAREMSRQPRVLVADNPTWGLDVGAIDYVHRKLLDMRARGGAVLLISLDLDELFDLSDRLLVIYRGRKMLEGPTEQIDHDELALAMAGRAAD